MDRGVGSGGVRGPLGPAYSIRIYIAIYQEVTHFQNCDKVLEGRNEHFPLVSN